MKEKFVYDFQLYCIAGIVESISALKSKIAALTPEFTNLIMREAPRTVQKRGACRFLMWGEDGNGTRVY